MTPKRRKVTRLYWQDFKSIGFVDAGACEGAEVMLIKSREVPMEPVELVVKHAEPGALVRDVVGRDVRKRAAELCESDPALSPSQAWIRFVDSDEGRAHKRLLAEAGDATVAEFVAKQSARARGTGAREEVLQNAAALRAEQPTLTYEQAFIRVLDCDPALKARYDAEREG